MRTQTPSSQVQVQTLKEPEPDFSNTMPAVLAAASSFFPPLLSSHPQICAMFLDSYGTDSTQINAFDLKFLYL